MLLHCRVSSYKSFRCWESVERFGSRDREYSYNPKVKKSWHPNEAAAPQFKSHIPSTCLTPTLIFDLLCPIYTGHPHGAFCTTNFRWHLQRTTNTDLSTVPPNLRNDSDDEPTPLIFIPPEISQPPPNPSAITNSIPTRFSICCFALWPWSQRCFNIFVPPRNAYKYANSNHDSQQLSRILQTRSDFTVSLSSLFSRPLSDVKTLQPERCTQRNRPSYLLPHSPQSPRVGNSTI